MDSVLRALARSGRHIGDRFNRFIFPAWKSGCRSRSKPLRSRKGFGICEMIESRIVLVRSRHPCSKTAAMRTNPMHPNSCSRQPSRFTRFGFVLVIMVSLLAPAAHGVTTFTSGNLAARRSDHTATLLPNVKVLVAGGFNGSIFLGSAELFDPATSALSSADSLATSRSGHTATLLPNGKVLVVGGAGAFASAEIYDPTSGTWSATSALALGRQEHTATLLPDGKVLVVGGVAGNFPYQALSNVVLYDPPTGSWTN